METVNVPMEELVPVLLLQMEQGGQASLVVTGNSMYPLWYHRRDQVILAKPKMPLKGHPVILYRRENGAYILHRIVRHKKDYFICSGDNQWQPENVTADQVLAVVTGFTRKGKKYYVNYWGYRAYVWLWSVAFPIRRPFLAMRRWLGRLRRKLRRKMK